MWDTGWGVVPIFFWGDVSDATKMTLEGPRLNSQLPQPLAPLGEGSFNSRFGCFAPNTEWLAGRKCNLLRFVFLLVHGRLAGFGVRFQ